MNLFGAFANLRSFLRAGGIDPISFYGATYHGSYEPQESQMVGIVADSSGINKYPPAAVIVLRAGEIAGSTDQFHREGNTWRFKLTVDEPFTPNEVIKESLAVFAVDRRGGRSKLMIEGAVQLSCIREATAPPSETELVIDFSKAGNSAQYRKDGWHGQEPDHVWTDGKSSTIALPFGHPGKRYWIEILAWPFVVEGRLPDQTLIASFAEVEIGKFYVRPGANLLEFDLSPDLTSLGQGDLHLRHPDAVRACDLVPGADSRMLALAFRRIKVKRYLQSEESLPADG